MNVLDSPDIVRNPYDFSHPVADPSIFSGRERQTGEIRYYLDQALVTPQPVNVAVIGQRAAGKSSLLNYIDWEATDRGFCVVRIALNEDDSKSTLGFFWKLFDAILTEVCETRIGETDSAIHQGFGGRFGKTYQTYLELTSTWETSDASSDFPFIFPLEFARSMSRGRLNALISEPRFALDLSRMQNEIARPVLILIDECNVLSRSLPILQRIRNVFANLPQYMLVFSGTPDLFPTMEEVFPQMAREFKRIEIDALTCPRWLVQPL